MLSSALETEIVALSARYGAPRRVTAELTGAPVRPLISEDRIGEVCMVVRRTNGALLAAVKTFYPSGAFRLLTGGIGHGERIEAALLRETWEETGLEVLVRQFLAVIEYRHVAPDGQITSYPFATFAFLLDENGGTLGVQDAGEQLGAFRELQVADLPAVADTLERSPEQYHPKIVGSWRDWGHFRAVAHRVIYERLQQLERSKR